MKSVIVSRYGGPEVLEIVERPIPDPGPGQIRVRTAAASVNAADWHLMRADPFFLRLVFGWKRPKIAAIGADIAGYVDAIGDGVSEFATGDPVFGDLSGVGFGACAEFVVVPAHVLAPIPPSVAVEVAAAIPLAGVTALQGLRDVGRIDERDRVLVVGASGGVGTFAVQIAKAMGATVTAICGPSKIETVKGLGADRVVDYSTGDITTGDETFDIVFDAGAYRSIFDYGKVLHQSGRYIFVGGANRRMYQAMAMGPLRSRSQGIQYSAMMAKPNRDDLSALGGMVAEGTVTPVIGARFPLSKTAEAIAALEARTVVGKIVVET